MLCACWTISPTLWFIVLLFILRKGLGGKLSRLSLWLDFLCGPSSPWTHHFLVSASRVSGTHRSAWTIRVLTVTKLFAFGVSSSWRLAAPSRTRQALVSNCAFFQDCRGPMASGFAPHLLLNALSFVPRLWHSCGSRESTQNSVGAAGLTKRKKDVGLFKTCLMELVFVLNETVEDKVCLKTGYDAI